MSEDLPDTDATHRPVTIIVGFAIILALTVITLAGVSAMWFEFDTEERVPETHWELEPSDPPVLSHIGGDDVECHRITITGDFGSGETLCEYFETETITEGDSAQLMRTYGEPGLFSLAWEDELGQTLTIMEQPIE